MKSISLIVTLYSKSEKRKTLHRYCEFSYLDPDETILEITALKDGVDLKIESWYGLQHLKFACNGNRGPVGIMISCKKVIYIP